jgi:putative flippase GtrA
MLAAASDRPALALRFWSTRAPRGPRANRGERGGYSVYSAVLRDFASFRRYAVVGILNNAGAYAFGLLLLALGLTAWQSIALMYPVATTVSFYANRRWSFGARPIERSQFPKYVCVYAVVYPAAIALTWWQEHMGIPSWLATLGTMGAAVMGIFLALNCWVFPRKPSSERSS